MKIDFVIKGEFVLILTKFKRLGTVTGDELLPGTRKTTHYDYLLDNGSGDVLSTFRKIH